MKNMNRIRNNAGDHTRNQERFRIRHRIGSQIRSALLLASVIFVMITGTAYAAGISSETGLQTSAEDTEREMLAAMEQTETETLASTQQTETETPASTEQTYMDDPYARAVNDWFMNTTSGIRENVGDAIEAAQTRRLGEEIIGKMKSVYRIIDMVTEETPWLIRVNKATCTVTVYRVLDVEKGVLMSDELNAEAAEEYDDAEEDVQETQDVQESQETQEAQDVQEASFDEPEYGQRAELSAGIITDDELAKQSALQAQAQEIVRVLVPVHACPCSVGAGEGNATPEGTFTIQDHLRWHELVGPTWGQWCCHFAPSYLFHSLPYERPNDPYSLQANVYNLIGQPASHGCVRLTVIDAKYIFEHVPVGGQVEIFWGGPEDDPLGTPERPYVGEWEHSYDPTDPELPENQ